MQRCPICMGPICTGRDDLSRCAARCRQLGSPAFENSVVPMAKSGFAKDQLKSFINRIERLEEERAALSADIKEVYSEAKGTGFDTKIMRQVIRMRKLDKADFQEQE